VNGAFLAAMRGGGRGVIELLLSMRVLWMPLGGTPGTAEVVPLLRMLNPQADAVVSSDVHVMFAIAGPEPPVLVAFVAIGVSIEASTEVSCLGTLPWSRNRQTLVVNRDELPLGSKQMVVGGFLTESCAGTLKFGEPLAFGKLVNSCVNVQALVTTPFRLVAANEGGPWSQVAGALESAQCSDASVARLVHRIQNDATRATFTNQVLRLVSRLVAAVSLAQDAENDVQLPFYLESSHNVASATAFQKNDLPLGLHAHEQRWIDASFLGTLSMRLKAYDWNGAASALDSHGWAGICTTDTLEDLAYVQQRRQCEALIAGLSTITRDLLGFLPELVRRYDFAVSPGPESVKLLVANGMNEYSLHALVSRLRSQQRLFQNQDGARSSGSFQFHVLWFRGIFHTSVLPEVVDYVAKCNNVSLKAMESLYAGSGVEMPAHRSAFELLQSALGELQGLGYQLLHKSGHEMVLHFEPDLSSSPHGSPDTNSVDDSPNWELGDADPHIPDIVLSHPVRLLYSARHSLAGTGKRWLQRVVVAGDEGASRVPRQVGSGYGLSAPPPFGTPLLLPEARNRPESRNQVRRFLTSILASCSKKVPLHIVLFVQDADLVPPPACECHQAPAIDAQKSELVCGMAGSSGGRQASLGRRADVG
jgi:hypothetical protein